MNIRWAYPILNSEQQEGQYIEQSGPVDIAEMYLLEKILDLDK